MKRVLIVFYSGSTPGAFKGERVERYIDFLVKSGACVTFLGLDAKLACCYGSNLLGQLAIRAAVLARIADFIFFLMTKKFVPKTFRRSLLCDIISFQAKKILRQEKPDAVLTQPYFFSLIKEAKERGIKVILECDSDYPQFMWDMIELSHDEANLSGRKNRDPWDYYPYVKKANRAIGIADKVIVFGNHAKETFVAHGVPDQKIISHIPPVSSNGGEFSIYPECPEFMWAGNHGARKGLHVLLLAWRMYKERGGKGKLLVCGHQSPSQRVIRAKIKMLRDVKVLGMVNVSDFFSARLRVLISVSYSEGFPRTVLEAMQHGCPVIANDVGGGTIISHRQDGWLVKLESESLCDGLFLVEREWASVGKIGEAARKTASHATSGYYESVIRELITG